MSKELNLDMEELAKKDELDEATQELIHKSAHGDLPEEEVEGKAGEESEKEEEGKESGKGAAEKTDKELLDADEEDLTDDEKEKRREILDTEAEETKKLLETPDEELDEEQLVEKKELLEATKEEEGKEKKSFEDRVSEYAKSNELSAEDAEKEVKQIDEIKSRYEGDLDKVAKSNLYLQRMASKAKNKLKKAQEASKMREVTPDELDRVVQKGQFKVKGRVFDKDALIQIGRTSEEWADIHDSLDDESLYRLVIKDLAEKNNQSIKKQMDQSKHKAETKRVEAVKELANYDNKFYDESKKIIENLNDRFIASDGFDVKNVLTQVKGDRYDDDIKQASKEAYRRGVARARVMDKKPPVGEGKGKKSKSSQKAGSKLTEAQKKEALDMFESANVSDEEKYKRYLNVYPDLKKNK